MKPKPVRLQRSRRKKLVSPNGLPIVYVGRPTKWGNPFKISEFEYDDIPEDLKSFLPRRLAVMAFRELILGIAGEVLREQAKKELRGKNLACWCGPGPCHADIWLEIANA